MHSLHGIYENGKITLRNPLPENIPDSAQVLVTFVVDEELTGADSVDLAIPEGNGSPADKQGAGFQSMREFERVKAHGNITVIDQDKQYTFPLNDYSQGGLSFLSQEQFTVGQMISAGITDPSNPDLVLMELQMEIRGVIKTEDDQLRIGCMFLDPVDEDLWHGLLQYLA
ncbi:MAG: PilZ domain-containing protein [Proteobacteria bacterium]|nr:PilZ domain-containing protein [Pseudomonadota bacterium]